MVRKHNRYDFNAFICFDICLMAQNMVGLGECPMHTGGWVEGGNSAFCCRGLERSLSVNYIVLADCIV